MKTVVRIIPKDYPVANKGMKVGIVYRFQCGLIHVFIYTFAFHGSFGVSPIRYRNSLHGYECHYTR